MIVLSCVMLAMRQRRQGREEPPLLDSDIVLSQSNEDAARAIAARGATFITHSMDEHHRWCAVLAAVGAVASHQRGMRVNARLACPLCRS